MTTSAPGEPSVLRYGWTTGACATAAATAAYTALLTGEFPDPVEVLLPKGRRPFFALATESLEAGAATAGVIKDAGDDPDVTHGALVLATVREGGPGDGVVFRAGEGVGTITLPGLPLPPGEPAINPVPRRMMTEALTRVANAGGRPGTPDVIVEISIPHGEEMARHTWNPRLGILGGLSVLGTTGVVVPYSCSAWIDSIRRGVDVARALGHRHVAGAVGSTSERVVAELYGLPDTALLDMGDFAGAVLKYLRRHPVPRLTIGGGFAKLSKLAAGHLDLHSKRSQVDLALLAELAEQEGKPELAGPITGANTALHALELASEAGLALGDLVAGRALLTAERVIAEGKPETPIAVDIVAIDRAGTIVGRAGPLP
ncbi:cobalt-precorrin-5B (C(1))-methyltransferase [Prauserella marina]|uniref:Cobalt-precorrin-5B C(1)-methyltransferase n=1 Tax=Prauserella marina TaxID=530584 RepID=A0A222VL55_9PSEU|nr:cobalt-precorrin-5B (C(1))-methyltransferase [Prauserella marina]ASR34624.1 cobalt-precorrin-5B (C(1))-methyltransferase [Prauserella marina]PWV85737.1 cobalt-precorrin-5B (C1)-methyltransferase [Prauserella marina]SDC46920.1 cobalt-precorrin-5B (C1)-methyltransferase [Prauserella marina]